AFLRRLRTSRLPYTTLFRSRNRREPAVGDRFTEFRDRAEVAVGRGFAGEFAREILTQHVGCRADDFVALVGRVKGRAQHRDGVLDRKSTRLNSSHVKISYAV